MEFNLKTLRYLPAIQETGSLAEAARRLNVAQPSISTAIARLEDVYGIALVERHSRGASLTEAGLALARHTRIAEQVLEVAAEELALIKGDVSGPLRIGGTPLATNSIIPDLISALARRSGRMDVRVIEGLDPVLRRMLLEHEIDLCISTLPRAGTEEETAAVAVEPLFQARMVAVVRHGHRLAGLSNISVRALSEELFITPPVGSAFRTAIDALFTVYGVPFPSNVVQVEVFGVIKEILKRGDGLTLVSDQIVMSDLADGSLVRIPLREQMAPRLFGVQYMRNRPQSPLLADCLEILRQTANLYEIPMNDEDGR